MASKLDLAIAGIAVAFHRSGWNRRVLMSEAATVAGGVKPKELAKFPDRWRPAIGAKAAGVVRWASENARPPRLLEPMRDIVVPDSDGDTVGKFLRRSQGIDD